MLQEQQTYHGFKLLHTQKITEVDSTGYIFEHVTTKARLMYLANSDENKVFSITFRTPAYDNTGIAHILEHSVLCGSEKYPLKEPFVELVKGSLNTFLNAMTFPDKTMYPIASMNNQDFHNLMNVYLDAVFFPNIYKNKYTLKQEGWHYCLESESDELIYKGVVYNEMKGVYSSPESILEQATQAALFPDTTYAFESGGHPDNIPELTQEAFEKFHSQYYHPSNSYIYLYGKMDILDRLAFLNDEYLSKFSQIDIDSHIALQPTFEKTVIEKVEYPLSEGEDTNARSFFNLSFVVGKPEDFEKYLALNILDMILVNMPGAPLKQAIIDSGIAQDIESSCTSSLRQCLFTLTASGTNPEHQDKFIHIVYAILKQLVVDGIDKELSEAALNLIEFKLREADFGSYPKGLIYNIRSLDTWLYDECPFSSLQYNELIEQMRQNLKGRYLENFIETQLMDNTHRALVVLTPKIGLEMQRSNALKQKMQAIKDKASADEIKTMITETQTLKEMQSYIDPPEVLEKIPLLKLSDIKQQAEKSSYTVSKLGNSEILYQAAFTNKIVYLRGSFVADNIPEEDISYAFLLSDMIGQLSTTNYSYFELAKQLAMHTGGAHFSLKVLPADNNADTFSVKFGFVGKSLVSKLSKLQELLLEILLATNYQDSKRLLEIINEIKVSLEVSLAAQGHTIANSRLASYLTKSGAYAEIGGLKFYHFINDLSTNFAAKSEIIIAKLQNIAQSFINSNGLLLSYCCQESDRELVYGTLTDFLTKLPNNPQSKVEYKLPVTVRNEGIYTPGMVQFVAIGGDYRKCGFEYHGSLRVVETILRYEYLWTNIRVKGGAYGAMSNFNRNGLWQFVSYRDPNLRNTLEVYKNMPNYLANVELSEREVLKYIIGTISKLDIPLTPLEELNKSITKYLLGITDEMVQQNRDQILGTTLKDIHASAPLLKAMLASQTICVVGSEPAVKEAQELFETIFSATVGQ